MDLGLIILGLLALAVVAFLVKRWQLRRAGEGIIQRFREHGAVREGKAKTLEEMGLHSSPKHPFLMRDVQVEGLSQLLRGGLVCQAEQKEDTQETRYYLDEQKIPYNIASYK